MKTIIILGNGFDLNLGLKTSYRDFIDSKICHDLFKQKHNYILSCITGKYHLKNWVDIEEELKTIARNNNGQRLSYSKDLHADYIEIVDALNTYLKRIQEQSHLRSNSLAAKLLKLISDYPSEFEIFTFNYTSLGTLAFRLGLNSCFPYYHVHGCLDEKSCILGFEDSVEGIEDYSYMIKSFNSKFVSRHLRQTLLDAKEVIIFGHSLGSTDYQYFLQFFKRKSVPDLPSNNSVRLSIITSNESSKLNIMRQLKIMNDNRTNFLIDQNDVKFYYSNDMNVAYSFHNLLHRLEVEMNAKAVLLGKKSYD